MGLLAALLIALLIGLIAYFLATLFPQSKAYAHIIGLIVSIIAFLAQLGYLHL